MLCDNSLLHVGLGDKIEIKAMILLRIFFVMVTNIKWQMLQNHTK